MPKRENVFPIRQKNKYVHSYIIVEEGDLQK